ncbi:MAG: tripartite tricarboxylate transporter TctB family protein [Rhizobacter sp.]|nr:tripartite tricarboxylate transporter TctB family protein [Rhizobacter sp.]
MGVGTTLVGLAMMGGAATMPSQAGYAGVGPNFFPWVVAIGLALCGVLLTRQALTGGYREMGPPGGAAHANWRGFAWLSAGLLLNAWLITTLGFILSCALCFALALHGLRDAEGSAPRGPRHWLTGLAIGIAIAAPVYWMFTQLLSIHLPGLTDTGWI